MNDTQLLSDLRAMLALCRHAAEMEADPERMAAAEKAIKDTFPDGEPPGGEMRDMCAALEATIARLAPGQQEDRA